MKGEITSRPLSKEGRNRFDEIDWVKKQYIMLTGDDVVIKGDEVLAGYVNRETGAFWHPVSENNFGKKISETCLGTQCRRLKTSKKETVVYSQPCCVFQYCPHPEICKGYGENHCLNPLRK